jgi:hypothetical protein
MLGSYDPMAYRLPATIAQHDVCSAAPDAARRWSSVLVSLGQHTVLARRCWKVRSAAPGSVRRRAPAARLLSNAAASCRRAARRV